MAGLEKQKVESKFFDLDDIIAKSESLACSFEIGELNPEFFNEMLGMDKPVENVEKFNAEAPFWLLESLKTPFSIHLPPAYSVNMQGILNADSRNINLSRQRTYFYANGMQLCHLMKEQDPDGALNLARCLLTTLTQRLGGIISNTSHQKAQVDRWDDLETKVFLKGKLYKIDVDAWLRQEKARKRKIDSTNYMA